MYQQSSRMLLKQADRVKKGKVVIDFFSYLSKTEELLSTPSGATTVEEFLNGDHIQRALATRAAYYVKKVYEMLSDSEAPSMTKQNDLFALEVNKMTKFHLIYIMYERARAKIASKQIKDSNINRVFMSAFANFALKYIIADPPSLYECGFFGPGSLKLLEAAYKQTLIEMRPQMISLVEILPDGNSRPSTIGNTYGDIYENQFDTAKASRLNTNEVPELYHTHMKPVMKLGSAAQAPKL